MYSFVPAAVDSFKKTGFGLYIKYAKSSTPETIVVKKNAPNYMWLVCPDRELVLIEHGNHEFSPMGENFDKYVDFNLYDDHVCNDLDVDVYMINYSQYGPGSNKSPMARRNGRNPNLKQPHIIADSGGFQLYTGKKTYLDPKEVIEWYNDNIDWGMVLDVPPVIRTDEYLKRSATIQGKNNEVMMGLKNDNVELINIVHGDNFAKRMEFLKQVDHPGINRLATPGYRDSTVATIAELLQLIFKSKRKFKHYHILGVYNLRKLVPIIKVANILPEVTIGDWTGVPLITSDASTPLQSAVNKLYHHQQSVYEPARRIVIGAREAFANVNSHLPCSCPVCANIKYTNILGILDKSVISNLIGIHNIFEIRRYAKMMEHLALTVSDEEYRAVAKRQLGSRAKDSLAALDMIALYKKDPDASFNKYKVWFNNAPALWNQPTGLYDDGSGREVLEAMGNARPSAVVETDEQRKERFEKTLGGYEKSHGIILDCNKEKSLKKSKKLKKDKIKTKKGK